MTEEKCKRCKGTGTIGGVYQDETDCPHCAGTGEKDWKKYWQGIQK